MTRSSYAWSITGGGPLLVGLVFLVIVMIVTTIRSDRPTTALQQVPGAPAPLYLDAGVDVQQSGWAFDAMQIVWDEAPRLTGLPLPAAPISVVLYPNAERYQAQVWQWLRGAPEIDRS